MAKHKTPILRRLHSKSGTIYTFPSATEDIGLNLNERRNKVALTHYALLNIPISDTSANYRSTTNLTDQEAIDNIGLQNTLNVNKNKFNPTFIPGQMTSMISTTKKPPSYYIASSLQNYAMNFETVLRNMPTYDYTSATTVSERVFWKWLKESGAIRWKKSGNWLVEEEERTVPDPNHTESDGSVISIATGYERVVQCIGEIRVSSTHDTNSGLFSETYITVPTTYGATQQYFEIEEDDNYRLGYAYKSGTYLEGRDKKGANDVVYTENVPYSDYYHGNDGIKYFKNPHDGLEWFKRRGDKNLVSATQTGFGYYLTDPKLEQGEDENDLLEIKDAHLTGSGADTSESLRWIRSRYDGVSLVKNIERLRKIYSEKYGNDSFITNDISFDALSYDDIATDMAFVTKDVFEFNAILLYYSVYDTNTKNILATNLYGVLFLDAPVSDTKNISNSGASTSFHIPHIKKVKSTPSSFGTSYSFKINIKTQEVYDNSDAEIFDQTTSASIQAENFSETFTNLSKAINLISKIVSSNSYITEKYSIITEKCDYIIKEMDILKMKYNDILLGKFANIATGKLNTPLIEAGKIIKQKNLPELNIEDSLYISSEYVDITKPMKAEDVTIQNTFQSIDYTKINDDEISSKYILDVLNKVKVGVAELKDNQLDRTIDSESALGENFITSTEDVITEVVINPASPIFSETENKIPHLIGSTKENHSEINYVKFIPYLIKAVQSIDPKMFLTETKMTITSPNIGGVIGNGDIIVLDADSTFADTSTLTVNDFTAFLNLVIELVKVETFNIYVYYPMRRNYSLQEGTQIPDPTFNMKSFLEDGDIPDPRLWITRDPSLSARKYAMGESTQNLHDAETPIFITAQKDDMVGMQTGDDKTYLKTKIYSGQRNTSMSIMMTPNIEHNKKDLREAVIQFFVEGSIAQDDPLSGSSTKKTIDIKILVRQNKNLSAGFGTSNKIEYDRSGAVSSAKIDEYKEQGAEISEDDVPVIDIEAIGTIGSKIYAEEVIHETPNQSVVHRRFVNDNESQNPNEWKPIDVSIPLSSTPKNKKSSPRKKKK